MEYYELRRCNDLNRLYWRLDSARTGAPVPTLLSVGMSEQLTKKSDNRTVDLAFKSTQQNLRDDSMDACGGAR